MNESPSEILEAFRGTGRSTRMLQEAIYRVLAGEELAVIVAEDVRATMSRLKKLISPSLQESLNGDEAKQFGRACLHLGHGTMYLFYFHCREIIWMGRGDVRIARLHCDILVDHAVMELLYGRLVSRWARYLLPSSAIERLGSNGATES